MTGRQEYLKQQKCTDARAAGKESNDEAQHPTKTRDSVLSKEKTRPGTSRPVVLNVTYVFLLTFNNLRWCCVELKNFFYFNHKKTGFLLTKFVILHHSPQELCFLDPGD